MMSPGFHMFSSFFRVAMGFIEGIRVGAECVEAGLGAEIDRPAAIFEAWKIGWVGVVEDPPAEGDEAWAFSRFERIGWHMFIALA